MSNFFGLFGCFKGKNSSGKDQRNTIKKPLDGEAGSKNGRVLPQQNNGEATCARCERPLFSKPERSSSMGGKNAKDQDNLDVSSSKNNRSNSIGQKSDIATAINDDGKLKTP